VDQTVTVTVNGTDDAPVITNAVTALVGGVQEDTTLTATGQLSANDIDNGDHQQRSVQGGATGSYGSIAVDASGKWTYTLANGTNGVAGAVQSLGAGEHHDEVFTVRAARRSADLVDQTVTVTVNGTDDAPVITNAVTALVGGVQEDTTLTATGQLS